MKLRSWTTGLAAALVATGCAQIPTGEPDPLAQAEAVTLPAPVAAPEPPPPPAPAQAKAARWCSSGNSITPAARITSRA